MKWPISSVSGVVVIILYCAFTFSSWALYPAAYNPINNWLSDLGNSTRNPNGAVLYNVGCVLTGMALFPFFFGLYKWYTGESRRRAGVVVTQITGSAAALSLIMIGVFSENYGQLHDLWSQIFFLLNLVVLIVLGITLFNHPRYIKTIAVYGFIVVAINLMFLFLPNTPLLEWFTVFTALGYVALLSYNMAKK
ncbi:MAG TPA: DUF998 domain-containing protein [Candidatus Acidoferrales bacterium]|nr:DUF998 domain-containing protein [Candidatus Acidoferrales bacterium]